MLWSRQWAPPIGMTTRDRSSWLRGNLESCWQRGVHVTFSLRVKWHVLVSLLQDSGELQVRPPILPWSSRSSARMVFQAKKKIGTRRIKSSSDFRPRSIHDLIWPKNDALSLLYWPKNWNHQIRNRYLSLVASQEETRNRSYRWIAGQGGADERQLVVCTVHLYNLD
jgi:hypothetical protein